MPVKNLRTGIIAVIVVFATTSDATMIGHFPGLDEAIERAEAIAIVRIDKHIEPTPDPNLTTKHRCYVYQTLKGDLKAGEWTSLDLTDTRSAFVSPFPLLSTHLVFLMKSEGTYRNLLFQGSILRLSPFGNENLPNDETIRGKIEILVERSINYWNGQWADERAFLKSTIE